MKMPIVYSAVFFLFFAASRSALRGLSRLAVFLAPNVVALSDGDPLTGRGM